MRRFRLEFLRSKVARRIFLLFVLCALVPITALAMVSFVQVRGELHQQSQRRLRQSAKTVGMSIIERLRFLETELEMLVSSIQADPSDESQWTPPGSSKIAEHFARACLVVGGEHHPLLGEVEHPASLSAAAARHLEEGDLLVLIAGAQQPRPRVLMVRKIELPSSGPARFTAEANADYVWYAGDPDNLPTGTAMTVVDDDGEVLATTLAGSVELPDELRRAMPRQASGQFEWARGDEELLGSYWSIPLASLSYSLSGSWHVVLTEPRDEALAPLAEFNRVFPFVVLLSLWLVVLMSIGQIRRSLVPLERLREGTKRIARHEFGTTVEVASGDEFEELAGSFNAMASRLQRQFHTLATMAELDRAVLSSLDTDDIVEAALTRIPHVIDCDEVGFTLLAVDDGKPPRTFVRESRWEVARGRATEIEDAEREALEQSPEHLVHEGLVDLPGYLDPLAGIGCTHFVSLPVFLNEELAAVISLGYKGAFELAPEELAHTRQLVDQLGVALSNARLIEQLDSLNWGALRALARTIDAKSPWTAGHSERVTELAMQIGREMGLGEVEIDCLRRGGLLHDIGKIATPAEILDKTGRLTDSEVRVVREHPRKGAEILEPLAAYSDVIPIVLQHHEWWDGAGYPDGLRGEEIDLKARIFAVADVFDAVRSDRPYRKGASLPEVVDLIRCSSGRQFDPKVVEAFLRVVEPRAGGENVARIRESRAAAPRARAGA